VPGAFSAEELTAAIADIITLSESDLRARIQLGLDFVRRRFSLENHAKYYLGFYGVRERSGVGEVAAGDAQSAL
jgi:hypothetical protein